MSIQELKILLIKQIADCEDKQQLIQLLAIMETNADKTTPSKNEKMIASLLQNKIGTSTGVLPDQKDIEDIQQSINELFGS